MGKIKDLTGKFFEYLLVLEFAGLNKWGHSLWRCRCSCGNECIVVGKDLTRGHTKSCGCLRDKKTIERSKKHGMTGTPIYQDWKAMIQRCENPNAEGFNNYGGRGIKVCERWHIFLNFYEDVSQLPHFGKKGYSLDRINNDGDYEPCNVRWTDRKTQARNTRRNVKVIYNGEEMTLAQAAEKSGIAYGVLKNRYRRGLRGEALFNFDDPRYIKIEYQGEKMCLKDAAEISGINYQTLYTRYQKGLRDEKLFKPVKK